MCGLVIVVWAADSVVWAGDCAVWAGDCGVSSAQYL